MIDKFGANDGLKLNREFFNRFVKIIKDKSGIFFDLSKMYFLETKLKKRMAQRGVKGFYEYLSILESDFSDREFNELLNEITVKETSFFRIVPHFKTLCNFVIPDLVARKKNSDTSFISLLSAGCSTGEEAYSMAISVYEKLKTLPSSWDFSVLGVDISFSAIEKGRSGLYGESQVAGIPDDMLAKYFTKTNDNFRVKDFLKSKALFKQSNLFKEEDVFALGGYDVIFCRYVLIYFDEQAKLKVLENLYHILNPGGFLFVAPSESYNVPTKFARVVFGDSVLFRKPF